MPDPEFDNGAPDHLLPILAPAPIAVAMGDWRARGRCLGEDPDAFSPSRGDPGVEARRICADCAVRRECLRYAIDADEHGIWAGLDQAERRRMRRRQRRKEGSGCGTISQSQGAA